jgi:PAS domain S-box-containing protein
MTGAAPEAFLEGGGELGALIRAYDWTKTPLGPPGSWPRSLKTAVRIMLTSRQPIWLGWGPELTYLYNDPYKAIIGGKHPRALGRPFHEVWSEIWDVVGPMADQVMTRDEGTYVEAQLLIMQRHGYDEETYYTFSYSPVPNDDGGRGGLICANTDDTRRVLSERQAGTLRELAERTANARSCREVCMSAASALATNGRDVPFALVYMRDDGAATPTLVASTPGADALAGTRWPIDEVMASSKPRFVELGGTDGLPKGAWTRPPTRAAVLPVVPPGQTGEPGVLVVGLNPFREYDGYYASFLDLISGNFASAIANARAYEQERRRAEALAELDRAKTTFFSNVSHEFRTPLTLMLGPVEDILAQPGGEGMPTSRAALEVVQRNGQRLLKLVNTLLDFARIEAGRVQAAYEPTDLAALTAELASNFRSACERAGLRLEVDCAASQPAYVDREMWEKIVLNLLSNAFKFTLSGGIAVRVRELEREFELAVADSGTGIPQAELPHMFERFHRVEGAKGRSFEGSGIGLALVSELVRLHGGAIRVESRLGEGTTFTVSIPKGAAHLPAANLKAPRTGTPSAVRAGAYVSEALSWLPGEQRGAQRRPKGDGKRVLLADDNADLRDYVRHLLADDYEVEAVHDGRAALAAARARTPDLIISDVMMPGLDGFGLLREVRTDEQLRTVPVVLLSARAGEEARMEGLDRGADEYLVKPFSARELLVRVESLLRSSDLRREAQDEIRDSEERLRVALQAGRMGTWQWDLRTNQVIWSPELEAIHGLAPGAFRGDFAAYEQDIHPDDRPYVKERIAGTMRGGEHHLEYRIVWPDGSVHWVEGRGKLMRDEAGKPLRVIGVCTEITERKRTEETLREEARIQETLNRVGKTLAAELDLERTVQAVTDAATELSGAKFGAFFYNVRNVAGESYMLYTISGVPRAAFDKFPMPRNTAVFAPTFNGDCIVRVEDIRKDPRYGKNAPHYGMPKGHLPVVSYLAVPVISRAGEVIGGLFFGHDQPGVFTERSERLIAGVAAQAAIAMDNARLHAERTQLVAQLQDADRRKDEFLATLAHELRNPLAPLRHALQLLELTVRGDARIDPLREMMERQVGHLVRLVDDLLEMSRISRGALELRKERIPVSAVVRNAVETSDPLIRGGQHRLSVALPDEPLWIEGDAVRVAQILSNLLNNAAKYTDPGGEIRLQVAGRGGAVAISVRDNGIGIAPETLPRLFEMFSRAAGPDRAGRGGLGIGLALSRRLAEMHGGTLEGRSEGPQRGAEFTLTLPLAAPGSQRLPAMPGAAPGGVPPRRVLVVDDNRDAAESLSLVLKFLGADVRVARDGPEALQAYEAYKPSVVFLDIGMPGMDGYEVARRIRQGNGGRPAIVALTGWGQEQDRRRAREAGFDHHLVKPAELGALQSILASLEGPPSLH